MTPYILTYTLPISVLVAVLISFGRLSNDNEIVAIRASGINLFRIIAPVIILGIIISLALFIFNDRASSYTHFVYRKTLTEIGMKKPAAAFEEGVFINSFDKYILFIYHVDRKHNRLNNIRIYEPMGEGKSARTIVAKSGEFITLPEKNIVKLKLMDGTSDEPDPENPQNFYKLNFKTYFMNLSLASAKNNDKLDKKPKEMNMKELRGAIKQKKEEGIDPAPLVTKMQEKMTLAFSTLVFILLGAPIAIITRRREKSINLGLAMLIIVVYYPLTIGCEALGLQGYLNPYISMWIPDILLGAIGVFLTYKLCVS